MQNPLRIALPATAAALVIALVVMPWRAAQRSDAPVSIGAVASPTAGRDAIEFARSLNADLARFANASRNLAVFEREPGTAPDTQYAVHTDIEGVKGKTIANARLIAVQGGQVLWSRRFEQSGPEMSALREQVAATIVNVLRCSFGGLGNERTKARPADLEQLMAICQSFIDDDLSSAQVRARQLTVAHPDLGFAWAILGAVQGNMTGDGDAALQSQAVANTRRAAAIAPDNVSTWLARAASSGGGPTSPQALPVVDAALRMHPHEPWLLKNRSVILFNLGYVQASVTDALESVRADPRSLSGRDIAVRRLAAAGRTQEAAELQNENERLWPDHPEVAANRARIATGDAARRDADVIALLQYEREFARTPYSAFMLAALHERMGDRQKALAWLARAPVENTVQQWALLFWPDVAGLRTEPAFFRKMADLGLVRWWLARGQWPDFCTEPGLKYNCAEEARKVQALARRADRTGRLNRPAIADGRTTWPYSRPS